MEHKQDQIIQTPLEEIMGDRFGRYSKYIIQDRALPDARDGLKPVQRRILYAMYEDGNRYDKGYRKSAKTVGNVIGNYHPHGDTSVYDAMVRMSQEWKIRTPQIDMQGNNGSIDDDPAAAMRYTEARLSKISEYLLMDIEKETVTWAPNFDDTTIEPTVLPARYPNLLVNGISGIAAGYATNIPPHNLQEVLDATLYRIQHASCNLEDVMKYIHGPDFPTGGIIQGKQGIIDAFTTGKGKIIIRSKVDIIQEKNLQQIIIHEIPYEVIKSSLVKKIDEVRLLKKIDGILDVRDESDRNGLRIVVEIRKDMDASVILQYLYKHTDLQVSYNYNIIAIVNKRPMQLGLLQMLDAFIEHRKEVIVKRSKYELNKKQLRCHILEGLIKAISVLDTIIELIRKANDKTDSKNKIIDRFGFSEEQAEAIVTMRLYRLSNTDVNLLQEEYQQLLQEIEELQLILKDETVLKKVMSQELNAVKKEFKVARLSSIEEEIEEIVIEKEKMIANEKMMLTISKDGYLKRVSMRSFAAKSEEITGLKESDKLVGIQEVMTLQNIIFFTQKGTYGYLPIYDIEESKWKDVGMHLNNKVKMTADEKIQKAFIFDNFSSQVYLISVSKYGMIKKTLLSEYEVSRNKKTMVNMKLNDQDELIDVVVACENDEILICSQKGYMVRYPISLIPLSMPKSKGVKAIHLVEDEVIGMDVFHGDNLQVILMNDTNGVKRIKLEDIDSTSRPSKGGMICKKRKSNPYRLQFMGLFSIQSKLQTYMDQKYEILIKDIPLMSREATFANPMNYLDANHFILAIEKIDGTKNKM